MSRARALLLAIAALAAAGCAEPVPYVEGCGIPRCIGCCLPDGGCSEGTSRVECGKDGHACRPCASRCAPAPYGGGDCF